MNRWKQIKNPYGKRSFIREEQPNGYKNHSNFSLVRVLNKQDRRIAELEQRIRELEAIVKRLQPTTEYDIGGFTDTGTFMCVLMTDAEAKALQSSGESEHERD